MNIPCLLFLLLLPCFSFSNDVINQFIFQDTPIITPTKNSIHLIDQRFKANDYQFNSNTFSFNHSLDWWELEFKQTLQATSFANNDLDLKHTQNKQEFNFKIKHQYGQVQVGNHTQSLTFNIKERISIFASRQANSHRFFMNLSGFDISESFSTQQYQSSFRYNINQHQDFKISCFSDKSFTSCNKVQLHIHNKFHNASVAYSDSELAYSDTNIESDHFKINYKLSLDVKKLEMHYQFEQLQLGLNHSKGEFSPFLDLFYLNAAANALGLGRKIVLTELDFTKTNFYVANSWKLNNHGWLTRADYSYINMSDFFYRDYESLLFLGIPILNNSFRIQSANLHLARVQVQYSYDFDQYQIIVNAKQLVYWDGLIANDNEDVEQVENEQVVQNEQLNGESKHERFHWWDGLNLTVAVKWEI